VKILKLVWITNQSTNSIWTKQRWLHRR